MPQLNGWKWLANSWQIPGGFLVINRQFLRTFHCPMYSWRIPGSPGCIPGFLVDSWWIPGGVLVESWYFPTRIPGIPGGVSTQSLHIPRRVCTFHTGSAHSTQSPHIPHGLHTFCSYIWWVIKVIYYK